MNQTLLAEKQGFEPVESDQFGCVGCAFEGDLRSDAAFETTACYEVACFEAQFYDGHPLKGTTKPIIWIRKEA